MDVRRTSALEVEISGYVFLEGTKMTILRTSFTKRLTRVTATDVHTIHTTPLPQKIPHWPSIPITESAKRAAHFGANAIFRALPTAMMPGIMSQLERRDRIVLILLDGKRTIQEIANLVHRSELDVARTVVRLLQSGYVEYRAP